jgi:hypothetical protein
MMIKRLTDDPMPLDSARPGSSHPPALQQVMTRALARMPKDRYTSSVQFAQEAEAAAAGWTGEVEASAAEGATQIMSAPAAVPGEATVQLAPTQTARPSMPVAPPAGSRPATPTTPRPITTPPVPRVKKKSPVVAIAAAAVIVVGGGAAAAVLMNGGPTGATGNDSLAVADTQVTGDTAARPTGGRNSGRTGTGNPRGTADTTRPDSTPITIPTPAVDLSAIASQLVQLGRDMGAAGTRSTAIRAAEILAERTDLPDSLRAKAAGLAAEGYFDAGNTTDACRMNSMAIRLDRGNPVYVTARRDLFECPQ